MQCQELGVENFKSQESKGCSRNYPGGGGLDPSTPRTHMESEPPDPQDMQVL